MAPRARGRAQSARVSESEGCTTQADCRPSVSGQSDARTHIGMASMTPTFVQFRNGAGAACPWPRTLGQGVGAQWRGLTGWLPTLGLRPDRCSHSSLRGWSTRTTFVHLETVRGLHARGHAHSARASESTGVVCKAGCRPWVSGQTDASTHVGMASTRPTFVHSETVRGLHARGRAHSARASDSNGVV
jgi:hypothetical protein